MIAAKKRLRTSLFIALAMLPMAQPLLAQAQRTDRFGGMASGPYDRLVILNAMVIPGHGGPAAGPYDIVIEGNTIKEMTALDPVTIGRRGAGARPTGNRVIDAKGMFVMPGMIDLHMHIREEPLPMEYN